MKNCNLGSHTVVKSVVMVLSSARMYLVFVVPLKLVPVNNLLFKKYSIYQIQVNISVNISTHVHKAVCLPLSDVHWTERSLSWH